MLEVKDVHKSFAVRRGLFGKGAHRVLNGVSLQVAEGECLGVIGESGSGKSTLGKIIMGLERADSGAVQLGGRSDGPPPGATSIVFQDYSSSVNPRWKVHAVVAEALRRRPLSAGERRDAIIEVLRQVGLGPEFLSRYPHELSGGQLQRVCIARAIATDPQFILLDEAVSSLDVSVQTQVLELLKGIKEERGLSYLFITHDVLAVTYICDRVVFFRDGRIVEEAGDIAALGAVRSEYARELLLHV